MSAPSLLRGVPDGAELSAIYEANGDQWTGTLRFDGLVFVATAPTPDAMLRMLDERYRLVARETLS